MANSKPRNTALLRVSSAVRSDVYRSGGYYPDPVTPPSHHPFPLLIMGMGWVGTATIDAARTLKEEADMVVVPICFAPRGERFDSSLSGCPKTVGFPLRRYRHLAPQWDDARLFVAVHDAAVAPPNRPFGSVLVRVKQREALADCGIKLVRDILERAEP